MLFSLKFFVNLFWTHNLFCFIRYEAFVKLLGKDFSIANTKLVLSRVMRLCRRFYPLSSQGTFDIEIPKFQVAYLAVIFPQKTFHSNTPLDIAVKASANRLVASWEFILAHLRTTRFCQIHRALTGDFLMVIENYLRDFENWKVVDLAKLIKRMRDSLIYLYKVRSQESTISIEDARGIDDKIPLIRSRLARIAGPSALIELDEYIEEMKLKDGVIDGCSLLPAKKSTNDEMVYELVIDPNFRLPYRGGHNKRGFKEQSITSKIFWLTVQDDLLQETPRFDNLIRALRDIVGGLKDILPAQESAVLEDIVHIDVILQCLHCGEYSRESSTSLIENIWGFMTKCKYPAKDLEIWNDVWAQLKSALDDDYQVAFVCGLSFLNDCVNKSRIDAANAKLTLLVPVIKKNGIDHLTAKFEQMADPSTEKTKEWLAAAFVKVFDGSESFINDILAENSRVLEAVHSVALIDLIWNPEELTASNCPETLILGICRLSNIKKRLNNLEVAATMMACAIYKLPKIEHETFYNLFGDIMDNFDDHESIQEVPKNRFCKSRSFIL